MLIPDKGHILVVDDEESIVNIVRDVLEQAGYNTYKALSGEEALDVYSVNPVDVVLTDIRMGGMDGFELMRHLKLLDKDLNIIVMTGFDSYETVLQALQSGAYDYMQKPLENHTELVATIDRACSNARLVKENGKLIRELASSHTKLSEANRSLVEANHRLKKMASTDSLTLLYNRRYFDQVVSRELSRRNRYSLAISLVMLDIDNFKEINDTYGHEAGDDALKKVASVINASARTSDIVARYGGEEFGVVLPQTEPANAIIFAERTRVAIAAESFTLKNGEEINLTISLGIAGATPKCGTIEPKTMIAAADKALYEAKNNGRNCYVSAPAFEELDDEQADDQSDNQADNKPDDQASDDLKAA